MTAATASEGVWLFLGAGFVALLARAPPPLAALALLAFARRVPEPLVILTAGAAGVALGG